ncbi:MAG: NrsF family protein [Alphaproteobacteria bacterium]
MKTDDLIELLAKDSAPPRRFWVVLAWAVAGGIVVTAALFFAAIGFRPDIAEAATSARFLFKFVVTIALAVTATWAALGLGRPGGRLGRRGLALAIAPALLVGAALAELAVLPESQWAPRLVGHNARFCLTLIPLLSIGPLACLLAALRRGAPSSPGLAGAAAGLAASGIGATFYAANCTDDSPLFVIAWYPIAALIVTAAGYLAGRKLLRW